MTTTLTTVLTLIIGLILAAFLLRNIAYPAAVYIYNYMRYGQTKADNEALDAMGENKMSYGLKGEFGFSFLFFCASTSAIGSILATSLLFNHDNASPAFSPAPSSSGQIHTNTPHPPQTHSPATQASPTPQAAPSKKPSNQSQTQQAGCSVKAGLRRV